jgi:predicted secreted acid phosphatase
LGTRTHKLVVVIGDTLVDQLDSIARKKRTSIEDLLKERVIQEWIGKRRIVNQRVFEEPTKRTRRGQ